MRSAIRWWDGYSDGGRLVVLNEEVAVDKNRMLLIGGAIVLVLVIAYMMFGTDATLVPR